LASIIIPAAGGVRTAANKSKTKVQFSQWGAGLELFKQEYGYYPLLTGATALTVDTGTNLGSSAVGVQRFAEILNGKLMDGNPLTDSSTGAPLAQNKRRMSFYSFSQSEIALSGTTVSSISDAFGNSEIYVVMDYNNDGLIASGTTLSDVRAGNATDGYTTVSGNKPVLPTSGVRAGVIFYSAGKGSGTNDTVTSW